MTSRKPRGLRPDEEELWDKVRQSAVPLHPHKRQALIAAIENVSKKPTHHDIPKFRIGQAATSKPRPLNHAAGLPDHVAGGPLLMDQKSFGRMKRGKLSPEARIDLHGMTVSQAHPALVGFILNAHSQAMRLVLVITGKGRTSRDNGPIPTRFGVLKHQVPHWLSVAPVKSVVLQVNEAHQKHGGTGAIYVYLRRHR